MSTEGQGPRGSKGLVWDRLSDSNRRQFITGAMRLGLGAVAAPVLVEALSACSALSSAKKTLTWSRGDDLRTQDPQLIAGLMEGTIARVLYDPLMDTDNQGNTVKALATDSSMSEDGMSYTFKIQQGVLFHDGNELKSDSVVFTFQRLLDNPKMQHASAFTGVLKQVTAVDPYTIKFDLAKPNPGLITSFGEPILSLPASKKYGADFFKQGIGTGAFKYNSWTPNARWIGDAWDKYWVKGLVKLDQITFRSISEDATRIAALQNGEVDVIDSLAGDQAEQLGKDPNINIVRSPATNELAVTFNVRKGPFTNKDARWAVAYAVDTENIVKNIVKAGKTVGASIPPGTVGYDDALFKKVIPYDMNKAKQLFAQAGLKPGTKISFKLNPAWFARMKESSEYIANQLRTLGFDVNLQFLEPGAYTQARKSGDFDMAIQEIGRAFNPDANLTTIIANETFGNFYKEINPNIVTMIEQARSELNAQKRNTDYQAIQQALYDDLPEFILYQEEFIWAVRKRVTGFAGRVTGDTRVWACGVTS
ncbi:MAG TPA: ABC transporter substrate-binding protein [Chloroflexota bacterium]|nr:ABC transporter substrate-binding protein [Chloroflexota bacterium]